MRINAAGNLLSPALSSHWRRERKVSGGDA
jgi:hypothetical protein